MPVANTGVVVLAPRRYHRRYAVPEKEKAHSRLVGARIATSKAPGVPKPRRVLKRRRRTTPAPDMILAARARINSAL